MSDPEEVEDLKQRDVAEYGNEDGPTFEFLAQEWREAGLKGNAVYVAIIEGARRINKGVNKNNTFANFNFSQKTAKSYLYIVCV